MITGENKSKVDRIWDTLWTGGITAPSSVVEQITYLLFMKLLDDAQLRREASAIALGVELKDKTFGDGVCVISENPPIATDYQNLRWSVFHNFEPTIMLNTISTFVFPFIKKVGTGKESAFSRYMANATFLINNAMVLTKVVSEIDNLETTNKDIMGDIYEYLLGKMAASGNLGQFRTPRHIIEMMVQLVKPTLKDTIIDPAMGTAGFLLGCINYVEKNQAQELMKTENSKHFRTDMFTGFDTDQTMLRIGAMNLLLHGIQEPNIKQMDAVSTDNTARNKYSLVMANPPFTGNLFKENISKDILAITSTGKTELLFVALFLKMLEVGGRCACIVPDGVLFGSSTAHKALRKELIENQQLQAVISMPSGVFKPYAGVSTAVLVFTKTNSAATDNVWFYDMKTDGYSLDDKRQAIKDNDIPDVIARFNNLDAENDRARTDQSFFVPKQEIVDNGYDLSINKYKKVEYVAVEYPPTSEILADLRKLEQEISVEMDKLEALLNG